MDRVIFVIDTSYLLELFAVPGFSAPSSVQEVRKRYALAIEKGSLLFVPLPCIFELANHVTDVRDGNKRRQLAQNLFETIESSVQKTIPWQITPSTGIESLPELFRNFAENYVSQGIGLTDTSTVHEALRLKTRHPQYNVHIWTKDHALKAREPDAEKIPFLG